MEGVDLSAFETSDGRTLGDDAGNFKELVRQEIMRIYCDRGEVSVIVRNGEDDEGPADTTVHLTQETPPNGGTDIGEGEYDPCNLERDNAAIVFGQRLLQLADNYSRDEWLHVFANVCAHEIGHTLGYGHLERTAQPEEGRPLFVELMLDRHTMAEMRRQQRLILDQTYCPSDPVASRRRVEGAVTTCGIWDENHHP